MSTLDFIHNVMSGNAVDAQSALNDVLASKAFEAIQERKVDLAQNLFTTADMNEEVEQIDELSTDKLTNYAKAANASRASLNKKWDQGKASQRDKEKVINHEKGENRAHKIVDRRAVIDKEMNEK